MPVLCVASRSSCFHKRYSLGHKLARPRCRCQEIYYSIVDGRRIEPLHTVGCRGNGCRQLDIARGVVHNPPAPVSPLETRDGATRSYE